MRRRGAKYRCDRVVSYEVVVAEDSVRNEQERTEDHSAEHQRLSGCSRRSRAPVLRFAVCVVGSPHPIAEQHDVDDHHHRKGCWPGPYDGRGEDYLLWRETIAQKNIGKDHKDASIDHHQLDAPTRVSRDELSETGQQRRSKSRDERPCSARSVGGGGHCGMVDVAFV